MGDLLETARRVLDIEAQGILELKQRLDRNFIRAVELILASPGKVITTGIGKSGIVARKIMATLASTGTTAIFLHPVEALHGDLGMVSPGDVVLALSNSGNTEELVDLIGPLKENGARIVALTGGLDSALARAADVVLDCKVKREACPMNLAPTTSTTATLAMGDALAVALMEKRRFNSDDFKKRHPGGHLGARLSLKVSQVMLPAGEAPTVPPEVPATAAIQAISQGGIGTVLIVDQGRLLGIFTDGDVRRAVVAGTDFKGLTAGQVMSPDPYTVGPDDLAVDALHLMEEKLITALPIVDAERRLLGVVHLHDLLGRGQVSFRSLALGSPAK